MPDWSDPIEIQKEAGIFVKFMHALMGLYVYVNQTSSSSMLNVLLDTNFSSLWTLNGTLYRERRSFAGRWCDLPLLEWLKTRPA